VRAILLLLIWIGGASDVFAIDFARYHAQDEINSYMRDLAAANPGLVRFRALGYSEQGREIDYVVISKGDPETLPALYLNGTHHGNEKSSTESVLGLIDYLVTHRGDPHVGPLLDAYAIYLQPLVNPDGHAANTRGDARGRDPNRDYSYPERSDDESFKTPPVRLVKELTDKVKFHAAIAYHSGMEAVLWPLCYTPAHAAEYDTFYTLSKLTAEAMGIGQYMQSFRDYPSRGEFIDYAYLVHGTIALTLEVSAQGNPPAPELAAVVRRAIAGGMTFMLGVMQLDEGSLEIRHAPEARPAAPAIALATKPLAAVAE
jgi:predicted deacylase